MLHRDMGAGNTLLSTQLLSSHLTPQSINQWAPLPLTERGQVLNQSPQRNVGTRQLLSDARRIAGIAHLRILEREIKQGARRGG